MKVWHHVIHPITQHFRRRRGQFLLAHFPAIRQLRICDLGGSRHFWEKLALGVPDEHITIYNISTDETQGVNSTGSVGTPVVIYDGKNLPVADNAFDLLVCNSVIEHVPVAAREALCKEMLRVSRSVFLQTPARSFPVEPHFLLPFVHWLPRSIGYQLIKLSPWRLLSRPTQAAVFEYWWGTQLLGLEELKALFPLAQIKSEGILGITKSYYVLAGERQKIMPHGARSNLPAQHGEAKPLARGEAQHQNTRPVRRAGAFSTARAWRFAVGPASARTLGP